jgi:hydroxymethylglutaryl-CoA reductase
MPKPILGFSKKSKEEKIDWLINTYLHNTPYALATLKKYWNIDKDLQKLHDDFIENTITNYYLPFGIAPNFLINDFIYAIPMVIEESSVIAAASNAAKFWLHRGGFKADIISIQKSGQIHIDYFGENTDLLRFFDEIKPSLISGIDAIQSNMKTRGGGLMDLQLIDSTEKLNGYYQIHATFDTQDAMGANFINSCLEQIANTFESEAKQHALFLNKESHPQVVFSILSNYVPECLVRAEVSCPVTELSNTTMEGQAFAEKFIRAIAIAKVEKRRAVTHNKGIMNGIDAVVLATGNDFRAVEAGCHAYAAKDGTYTSLTHAKIEDGIFTFWIEIPLAIGTIGGLTNLHPLVKIALDILQKPNAKELMKILAVAGLAQNFAAIRSLITTGIQKGHMKMHLINILNLMNATEAEKEKAIHYFKDNKVSNNAVASFLNTLRNDL